MTTGRPITQEQMEAARAAANAVMPFTTLDDSSEGWVKFANNLALALATKPSASAADALLPAYFCNVERPYAFARQDDARQCFDLDRDQSVEIEGNLFLVSENANGGVFFPVSTQAMAIDKIQELQIGEVPLAAFYPGDRVLRVYPDGMNCPERQYTIAMMEPRQDVTIEDVQEVIDLFHRECLCTPQLTAPVFWEDASNWTPESSAEKNIQWPLKAALVLAFRNAAVVRAEEVNAVGDTDFILYRKDHPQSAPLAVVEVKVQKSRRAGGAVSPSETRKEFVRGLIQTAAYREQKSADFALLACFDLREPGAGSDAAWTAASERARRTLRGLARGRGGPPTVISWMVFANSQSAQAAQAMGALSTDDILYPVTRRPNHLLDLTG